MQVQNINDKQIFGMRNITVSKSVKDLEGVPKAINDAYSKIKQLGDNETDLFFYKSDPAPCEKEVLIAKVRKQIYTLKKTFFGNVKMEKIDGSAECPPVSRNNTNLRDEDIMELVHDAQRDLKANIENYVHTELLTMKNPKK